MEPPANPGRFTTAFNPGFKSEAKIYAAYLLEEHPAARIGVLYQNDDQGRDYLNGLKEGLGDQARTMIVAEEPHELADPTIDSQIVKLRNTGADVLFAITSPKFDAQAIRKVAQIGWNPVYIIDSNSAPSETLRPTGFDNARGTISATYVKDPTDAQWADDPGMKRFKAFMAQWMPGEDPNSGIAMYGYMAAKLLVHILGQAGDELTRDNIMKQVTNIQGFDPDLMLPGITTATANSYKVNRQMQMMRSTARAGSASARSSLTTPKPTDPSAARRPLTALDLRRRFPACATGNRRNRPGSCGWPGGSPPGRR